jgi:hypothetical protein
MSEFCSQCSPNFHDWDLFKLALDLDNQHSESFICEGCNIRGIYKDESGKLFLAKTINNNIELFPINLVDLLH